MSRYDIWAARNVRNNGVNDVQLDINLGGGNLNGITKGKEQEYIELRAKVTNSTLIRMKELLNICKSELEFFSRLDDDGIPLTYLVALGITTEENISSYQIMRKRGIDTYRIQEQAIGKSIDSAYMREIKALEKPIPPLKNSRGENIERILSYAMEKPVVVQDTNKDESTYSDDKSDIRKGSKVDVDILTKEVSLDDTLNEITLVEEKSNEDFSSEEVGDWRNILTTVKRNTEKVEQGVEEEEVYEDLGAEDNRRTIYIIANEFEIAYNDKYRFVFVKNTKNLGLFTSSRNNLLVVTQDVPKPILTDFLSWLKGIIKSEDKYRITTLKNSPVRSQYIQDELYDLSEESLDEFYDRHKNDEYIGDGVGKFFDLTSAIEDLD